jgi:hypothetical protein
VRQRLKADENSQEHYNEKAELFHEKVRAL